MSTNAANFPGARDQVKLVVWDLDDTIWRGILAEGPVALLDGRERLLTDLVDRGVMVSISSKNDPGVARDRLQALGLWDLFVFPRIDWSPKGPRIAELIESAGLRPQNVMFVDDLPSNLDEAAFFSPGIQTSDPAAPDFDDRMAAILASGKDDRARTRLAEYRILEAKTEAARSYADNHDFLRSCEIRVRLSAPVPSDAGRIHELIGRTNQLNYTKRRVSREDVEALIRDPLTVARAVRVEDRFGDYGLVGFTAVRAGQVEQLAFSCRILGMGVERAIYERLGSPAIVVAEPVSAPLEGPPIDWLDIVESTDSHPEPALPSPVVDPAVHPTILVVGGCDVQAVVGFIANRERVSTYMNYSPPDRPRLVVHRDSIDYLLAGQLTAEQRERILDEAPFLEGPVFDGPDWDAWEHVVYSPLIDFVQAKYVSEAIPGFYCSFGDMLEPDLTPERIGSLAEHTGLAVRELDQFAASWRPAVKPDEVWRAQLHELFGRLDRARTVTVLLGAERTFDGLDAARIETHRRANALLREVAAEHRNTAVIEVDPFIHGPADFRGSIRHYNRRVYRDLAASISERVGGLDVAPPASAAPASSPAGTRASRPGMTARIARRVRRLAAGALRRR